MVYLKIPIGNEAHEDTTFIQIHGRYSIVNMQYSYAKYHFSHTKEALNNIHVWIVSIDGEGVHICLYI